MQVSIALHLILLYGTVALPDVESYFQNRTYTTEDSEERSHTDVEDWYPWKKRNLGGRSLEDDRDQEYSAELADSADGVFQTTKGSRFKIIVTSDNTCRPGKCARDCKCCANISGNRVLEGICNTNGNVCCACCEKERERQAFCKPKCMSGYIPVECDDICDYETVEILGRGCRIHCSELGSAGCMDDCQKRPFNCNTYCSDEYIIEECVEYCKSMRPPQLGSCVPEGCEVAPPAHCLDFCKEDCTGCNKPPAFGNEEWCKTKCNPFYTITICLHYCTPPDYPDYPTNCDCDQEYIPIDCEFICLPGPRPPPSWVPQPPPLLPHPPLLPPPPTPSWPPPLWPPPSWPLPPPPPQPYPPSPPPTRPQPPPPPQRPPPQRPPQPPPPPPPELQPPPPRPPPPPLQPPPPPRPQPPPLPPPPPRPQPPPLPPPHQQPPPPRPQPPPPIQPPPPRPPQPPPPPRPQPTTPFPPTIIFPPSPPSYCVQICFYKEEYVPPECREFCEIVITSCPIEPPCPDSTPSYCPPTPCFNFTLEPPRPDDFTCNDYCDSPYIPEVCVDECATTPPTFTCDEYCDSPYIPENCVEECTPDRPMFTCDKYCDSAYIPEDCVKECHHFTGHECLQFCYSNDIPGECTDVCKKENLIDELCLEMCATGGHIPECCLIICQQVAPPPLICKDHCFEEVIPEECVDTCWNLVEPSQCKYFCFTDDIPSACFDYCKEIGPITPEKCVLYCSVLFYPGECNNICPGCSISEDFRRCDCAESLGRHTCRKLHKMWIIRNEEKMSMNARSGNYTSTSINQRALKLQDRNQALQGLANQESQPEPPKRNSKSMIVNSIPKPSLEVTTEQPKQANVTLTPMERSFGSRKMNNKKMKKL